MSTPRWTEQSPAFPLRMSVDEAAALLRADRRVIEGDLASGRLPAYAGDEAGTHLDGRRLLAMLREPLLPGWKWR